MKSISPLTAGLVAAAAAGLIVAAIVLLGMYWGGSTDFGFFGSLGYAIAVGMLPGVLVGTLMGMHGESAARDNIPTAPLWGLATGGIIGLTAGFMPGLMISIGTQWTPALVTAGAIAGLALGVAGWQAGYWWTKLQRSG